MDIETSLLISNLCILVLGISHAMIGYRFSKLRRHLKIWEDRQESIENLIHSIMKVLCIRKFVYKENEEVKITRLDS